MSTSCQHFSLKHKHNIFKSDSHRSSQELRRIPQATSNRQAPPPTSYHRPTPPSSHHPPTLHSNQSPGPSMAPGPLMAPAPKVPAEEILFPPGRNKRPDKVITGKLVTAEVISDKVRAIPFSLLNR